MALNIFNFENEKEFVTFDIEGKSGCRIKLQGTTEKPYFCYRDVCEILELKNLKSLIHQRLDKKYIKYLSELQQERLVSPHDTNSNTTHPKIFIGKNYENLGYHDGRAVYVNESGLYRLIFASRVAFATQFQDYVFEIVLPSIRKYGEYSVKKSLEEKHRLEMETRIAEIEQEKSKRIAEIEQEKSKQIEALSEKTQRMERRIKRTKDILDNIKLKEKKNEWIYIATSANYEKDRIFKIGSTERLSKRLSTYNTGRVESDVFFYCWVKRCYKCKDLDYAIQNLLSDFKVVQSQEMYKGIKFADLVDILEFICENYDKSIEFVNAFVRERLERSLEENDEPVPRVDLKKVTMEYSNGVSEIVPVEELEREDIRTEIFKYIEECGKASLERRELVEALSGKIKGVNRKTIWAETKDALGWKNSKTPVMNSVFIIY